MIKKTLYFGNPAYLSMRNEQLEIRMPEVEKADLPTYFKQQAIRTIPIEDIGVMVIDHSQITITQSLLASLTANACAVIFCDTKRMPSSMLLPLEGNSIQNERFRAQINASLPLRKQLWQQTVQQKILNQAAMLAHCSNAENRCMLVWANDVKSGDATNLEARAAVYYWKQFFPFIPNFIRGREEAPPNNLLNYGYAILRAVVARSLVVSGLLPTLGIHHHNRYNAYCLADDIMEPYRPFVDQLVFQLVAEYGVDTPLNKDVKTRLLGIPTLDVTINRRQSPLMVAVSQTTASLAKCFNGELRKIIYPDCL